MDDLKCLACGGTKFSTRSLLMGTTGATLIGLNWLNPTVMAYICEQCGYIMLYANAKVVHKQEEQRVDPVMLEEERKRAIESFKARSG
jgi:predicted nucleic-acid-binding Zn-ribbon protein